MNQIALREPDQRRPLLDVAAPASPLHPFADATVADLQPVIDELIATLRAGLPVAPRERSVTVPAAAGKARFVSLRRADLPAQPSRGPVRGLDARALALVVGTIHERIGEPLSVSMLSAVAGLSRSHFSHAFRATTGRTPHAHIVQLRIARAMSLMADTDLPLSEIALVTGFSDQAHFSNTFRRAAGTTPTRWRRTRRTASDGPTAAQRGSTQPNRRPGDL